MQIVSCLCGREFNSAKLKACPACGMATAQVLKITPDQRRRADEERFRRHAEEDRRRQMSDEERRREIERSQEEYIAQAIARMEQAITEGRTPALHRLVLMPSDYSFMGQSGGARPDVMLLAEAGFDGWETIGVIPRTTGLPLTNAASGRSFYGGGVGGLTDGAYLLLRLPVTARLLEDRREFVASILRTMHDAQASVRPGSSLPQVPTGDMNVGAGAGSTNAAAAGAAGAFFAIGVSRAMDEIADTIGDMTSDGGGDFDIG